MKFLSAEEWKVVKPGTKVKILGGGRLVAGTIKIFKSWSSDYGVMFDDGQYEHKDKCCLANSSVTLDELSIKERDLQKDLDVVKIQLQAMNNLNVKEMDVKELSALALVKGNLSKAQRIVLIREVLQNV